VKTISLIVLLAGIVLVNVAGSAEPELKPRKIKPAPEFTEIGAWINSEPLTMKAMRGKVVVVHFWAFGCINCVHNLPHYQAWQKDFAGDQLVIVGIHTPETDAERKLENLKDNIKQREIRYAVAFDDQSAMWKAWGTRYWPSVALVDRQGNVRYTWEGELNWKDQKGEAQMRKWIEELIAER
jgi:thiol-disulfide isomerase/thioredoxin